MYKLVYIQDIQYIFPKYIKDSVQNLQLKTEWICERHFECNCWLESRKTYTLLVGNPGQGGFI